MIRKVNPSVALPFELFTGTAGGSAAMSATREQYVRS